MMCDFGTGNNNKLNWVLEDKQELIDIIETIYKGAKKGRGLVVSPKGNSIFVVDLIRACKLTNFQTTRLDIATRRFCSTGSVCSLARSRPHSPLFERLQLLHAFQVYLSIYEMRL